MKNFPKRRSGCIRFVWESIDGLEVMDYVDVLVDGEFVKEEADPASLEGKCQSESDRCKSDKKEWRSRLSTVLKAGLPIRNGDSETMQKSELNILQIK